MAPIRKMHGPGHGAFTLVELLVVVLILGALAFVSVPRIGLTANTAKINSCDSNIDIINSQIEAYWLTEGDWPQNFNKLTDDANYFPEGKPVCPFGTGYSIQGSIHRAQEHNH